MPVSNPKDRQAAINQSINQSAAGNGEEISEAQTFAPETAAPETTSKKSGGIISSVTNFVKSLQSDSTANEPVNNPDVSPVNVHETLADGDETTEISAYKEGNYYLIQRGHINPEDNPNEGNTGNNQYIMADFDNEQYQAGAAVTKLREENGQTSMVSYEVSAEKEKGSGITGSLSVSRLAENEAGDKTLQQNATLTPDSLTFTNKNTQTAKSQNQPAPDDTVDSNAQTPDNSKETTITANIDVKHLGNGDLKRTVIKEDNSGITTNEQSGSYKNGTMDAAVEQKKDDGNGTVKTKRAETTYNTQTGGVDVDLSKSIVNGESTKTNVLHLNSPAEGNDSGVRYTGNTDDGNGNTTETIVEGSYGDAEGININAKKTKVTSQETPRNKVSTGDEEQNEDNYSTVTTSIVEGGYSNGLIRGYRNLKSSSTDGSESDKEKTAQYDTNSGEAKVDINKTETTIVSDDNGTITKSGITNNNNLTYNSRETSVNIEHNKTITKNITDADGNETEISGNRTINGSYNNAAGTGEFTYENHIDKTKTGADGNEIHEAVDTSVTGTYEEGAGNLKFFKSKLGSNGRRRTSQINGDISENGNHIGLSFGRTNKTINQQDMSDAAEIPADDNAAGETQAANKKPKKDNGFYTSVTIDRVSDENSSSESADDDYDIYGDSYDFSGDDDFSGYEDSEYPDDDIGTANTDETQTEINAAARYRHGNTTFSVEGGSKHQRAGVSHHSINENGAGTAGAFIENGQDGINAGLGGTYIKKDKNGGLGYAASGNAKVNVKTGAAEITGGIAAPVKDKDGNYVGTQKGYAQYNSANKSVTIGGQTNRIFYKKTKTQANQDTQDIPQEPQDPQNLYEIENEELNPEEQELANADSVGAQQEELAGSSVVDEALSQTGQSLENMEVAGGYSIKAEIGHAQNRNPAVQYNIDAKGFVNTTVGGKDATFYGRVTSTNGSLDEVNGVYGSNMTDPIGSNENTAAGSNTKLKKFRDTSFQGAGSSDVSNRTSLGAGAVIGNPSEQGANYAGAVNGVFENGKLTQFTGMGRAEYVYNANENDRQAAGAEISYSMNKNNDTSNFQVKGYYDHTFNEGKTRIGANLGYSMESDAGIKTQTRFAGFGARQALSKKIDLYGQAEIGQTRGFGAMGSTPENYMALRTGVQYHLDQKTVLFGEYNTGYGSASDSSMLAAAPKDKFGAGNFMVGIGMRF